MILTPIGMRATRSLKHIHLAASLRRNPLLRLAILSFSTTMRLLPRRFIIPFFHFDRTPASPEDCYIHIFISVDVTVCASAWSCWRVDHAHQLEVVYDGRIRRARFVRQGGIITRYGRRRPCAASSRKWKRRSVMVGSMFPLRNLRRRSQEVAVASEW